MTNSNLIKHLEAHNCSQSEIKQLKQQYELIINSRRTLERITTIKELIKILTKRDELNDDVLETIRKTIEPSQKPHASPATPPVIPPSAPVIPPNAQQSAPPATIPTVFQGNLTREEQLEMIYSRISEEIGTHWRDFARGLNIRESYIDELETSTRSLSERVRKVLQMHQNRCDPNQWRIKLLGGLEKARRYDLRFQVEALLDRFSITRLT